MQYYTLMAEWGDAESQYQLGLMLRNGNGFPEDYWKGIEWIEKAAEQGHPEAIELYWEDMAPDPDERYHAYS